MGRYQWVAELTRQVGALRGRSVETWVGVEMALRESGPQFDDPEVPFLQLWGLQASLADGGSLRIGTTQDDDRWGLWPRPEADPRFQDDVVWDGIYRRRTLAELPTGPVEQVSTAAEDGLLAEVGLHIGGRPLLLIAGEAWETADGGLKFHRLDESVLAFTDPAAAARIRWTSGVVTPHHTADSGESTPG